MAMGQALGKVGLRQQIASIGIIGAVIMIAVAALVFVGIGNQEQKQKVMDGAVVTNDLVTSIKIGMLQARRHEKDFFLRNDDKHAGLQKQVVGQVLATVADLTRLLGHEDDQASARALGEMISRYSQQFNEVVALRQQVGLNETAGLTGRLRTAVHAIEAALKGADEPQLQILMLTLRRHEKDFLARKDQKYVEEFTKAVDQFSAALTKAALATATQTDMRAKLADYRDSFMALAGATAEAATATKKMSDLYAALEPVQEKLETALDQDYQAAKADITAARTALAQFLAWVLGGGVLVLIVLAVAVGTLICRPLVALTGVMTRLADGDHDVTIGHQGDRNELGSMSRAVEVFRQNAIEKARLDEAERRRLEAERQAAEAQRQREQAIGAEIAALIDAVAAGDLTSRVELAGKDGFYRTMSEGINRLTDTVQTAINDIARVLGALADGNLTLRITKAYQGAFDTLKTDVNTTADRLADVVGQIRSATDAISQAAAEVSAGSSDLAERTEQQASSLEETAASLEELGATVRTAADNAQRTNRMAANARGAAEQGSTVAASAIDAMKEIADASRRITEIISVIDEIAFQTNLLALNAAVEAARAGDAGKGFAVVAQEVRLLAQRSAQASKEIKSLILNSESQVQSGVDLVKKAGDTLTGIARGVHEVAALISEIATGSTEQASSLEQINSAVASMDEMTQKNAALVEQTTAAAASMNNQARDLDGLMTFFKIA
jgi:methyl-accepting chemotaxis protein